MSVKNTFWSLFTTLFIGAFMFWIFRVDITFYFIKKIDVTFQATSITSQFTRSLFIPFALLLLPFIFLLANRWIKFRSIGQVWLFVGSALVFGCIGFYLRRQLVFSTIENAPTLGGMKPVIQFDQLQFEKYFFLGTLIGSLIIGVWMGYLNQKLTESRNGKL